MINSIKKLFSIPYHMFKSKLPFWDSFYRIVTFILILFCFESIVIEKSILLQSLKVNLFGWDFHVLMVVALIGSFYIFVSFLISIEDIYKNYLNEESEDKK